MKKNIYFFSTNRADYGLIKNVYDQFKKNSINSVKLVITGKLKLEVIEKNYIKYQFREFSNNFSNNPKNISLYINKFNIFFKKHKPDLIFLLGDRYETLGIALSAFYNFIKIAHISGGEETEGSMDNVNRHLITKLSNLHFVYFHEYRKRVVQLGENPKNVYICNPLFIDSLRKDYLAIRDIEKKFNFSFKDTNALVTFHPITNKPKKNSEYLKIFLDSLSNFKNINFIFTSSNHDGGGGDFNKLIKKYCKNNKSSTSYIENFGHKYYYSCMSYVNFVIGNSSSGVIEAPLIGTPSINLGNRQKGRIKFQSVFNCAISKNQIMKAIKKVLLLKKKNKKLNKVSPSKIILNKTNIYLNRNNNLPKVFFDI